jgi:hypothetical protein
MWSEMLAPVSTSDRLGVGPILPRNNRRAWGPRERDLDSNARRWRGSNPASGTPAWSQSTVEVVATNVYVVGPQTSGRGRLTMAGRRSGLPKIRTCRRRPVDLVIGIFYGSQDIWPSI